MLINVYTVQKVARSKDSVQYKNPINHNRVSVDEKQYTRIHNVDKLTCAQTQVLSYKMLDKTMIINDE